LEEGVDGEDALLTRNGRFASVNGENIRRRLIIMVVHLVSDFVGKRAMVVLPDFEAGAYNREDLL